MSGIFPTLSATGFWQKLTYYFIVTRQMMLFGDGGIFPEDEDEHDRDE